MKLNRHHLQALLDGYTVHGTDGYHPGQEHPSDLQLSLDRYGELQLEACNLSRPLAPIDRWDFKRHFQAPGLGTEQLKMLHDGYEIEAKLSDGRIAVLKLSSDGSLDCDLDLSLSDIGAVRWERHHKPATTHDDPNDPLGALSLKMRTMARAVACPARATRQATRQITPTAVVQVAASGFSPPDDGSSESAPVQPPAESPPLSFTKEKLAERLDTLPAGPPLCFPNTVTPAQLAADVAVTKAIRELADRVGELPPMDNAELDRWLGRFQSLRAEAPGDQRVAAVLDGLVRK